MNQDKKVPFPQSGLKPAFLAVLNGSAKSRALSNLISEIARQLLKIEASHGWEPARR
jgi:hypothetical protein